MSKDEKKLKIFTEAFKLFKKNGTESTSIQEIVDKAGVAKGTFYLYFKDKYDLQEQLITKKSNELFSNALEKLQKEKINKFDDQIIFIIDYILDYLIKNKALLKFISKNLSFGLYNDRIPEIIDEGKFGVKELFMKGIEENNIKFFEIVSSLVEKKNKRAMFYMGIALMNGDGIDLDLKKGLKLLEKVADMGYSLADYQLCIYYANHYAISKVQKYKNKIKLNGSKKAKYMLAMSYYNVMNYADALTFMLSSAKAGYKPAYQRLALVYKNGLGTKKSQKDSELWEVKAKESGCYFTNIEKDED